MRKVPSDPTTLVGFELQWGRNLIVAEGRRGKKWAGSPMSALQWGRNLIVAEGLSTKPDSKPYTSFNGAAT